MLTNAGHDAHQCGPRCLAGCAVAHRPCGAADYRAGPGFGSPYGTATGSGTAAAAMTYSARLVSSTKDRLRHLPNRALRMTAQCSMVGCGTVMARIPVAAHRPGDTSSRRAHTPGAPLRRIPGPRARPARRDARPRPHLGRRCGAGKIRRVRAFRTRRRQVVQAEGLGRDFHDRRSWSALSRNSHSTHDSNVT